MQLALVRQTGCELYCKWRLPEPQSHDLRVDYLLTTDDEKDVLTVDRAVQAKFAGQFNDAVQTDVSVDPYRSDEQFGTGRRGRVDSAMN